MSATYTFDVFATLDGYGSYGPGGDWGGYWGKQGPELLEHRLSVYAEEQRMVFGANTYRVFGEFLASSPQELEDAWVSRMLSMPATVLSSTLEGHVDQFVETVVIGDVVDGVARLMREAVVW